MLAKVIALVVPLGLDTFVVAAAIGMIGIAPARRLRLSLLFCAFEAGMPLVGLALGAPVGQAIGGAADYVAVGMLLAVGLYALFQQTDREEERLADAAAVRGAGALLVATSISLDELAIGFTLGVLRAPAGLVIGLIAVQALIVTQLGVWLGNRIAAHLRESVERLAGGALMALAIVLLAEKLVG